MSRLELFTPSKDQLMVESLYKNLEQRIVASPPGICPVDITRAFIEMCHAQTCGKCVPCRVGLHQLKHMITNVLNGDADYEILDLIEETALSIMQTADCAIGSEAAKMVWRMVPAVMILRHTSAINDAAALFPSQFHVLPSVRPM